MKAKLFIASALAVLACGNMSAGKSADQVRIYLNPGHGSWGPNNRPCNTIGRPAYTSADPDTTGFYESNTNLHKCFGLLDDLVKAGVPFDRTKNQTNSNPARIGAALDLSQNIVMSHVKVGPYPYTGKADDEGNAYNRPLSEIREEVEVNNFDIFISIHSNAGSEGSSSNYLLYLYRGADAKAEVEGSKEMAQAMWPYSFGNKHMTWSYYSETNMNVRGDWDFYGKHGITDNNGTGYDGYLGVLLHGVPGFLVEGYFHTYQPARQRAMNDDVCRHEGHLYARGLINYMGWKKETTGDIYGIVRDLHEKFADPLYTPAARTDDQYKPLNGVTVKLLKDGKEVASYTTDNEWNGAFFFKELEPGEYSMTYTAEGYKGATEEYLKPVTVKANETAYVSAFLEAEGYEPPKVVYENYTDPVKDNKAFGLAEEYNMVQAGTEASPLAEQLADKTVRRQIVRNGKLYVLALDTNNEPFIYAVNLADNSVSTVSTNGLTLDGNKDLKLSDIAFTADNYLIGSSYGENQFSADQVADGDVRGDVAIYKWANDENGVPTGDPAKWFTSQNSGNYYNAMTGQTLAYSGTTEDGSAVVTAQTKGSSASLRFVEFGVSNNTLATTTFINKNVSPESNYTATKLGSDYQLVVSPQAENQYIIDGSLSTPLEWQTAGSNVDAPLMGRISEDLMGVTENGVSCFKYAEHDLMVAPIVADGKVTGVKLIDITEGLDNAKLIKTETTTVEAAEAKFVSAAGVVATKLDDSEKVVSAAIELYLIRDGKISKFTTEGVEQPKVRGHYAYGLKAEIGGSETTFSFKSTGDAVQGRIVMTNSENEETEFPTGEIKAGDNSVVIDNTTIPKGMLKWRVEVVGKNVAAPQKVFTESGYGMISGIMVDNNPASENLGTLYVSNGTTTDSKAKGIFKFDQNLKMIGTGALHTEEFNKGNGSSPFRLGMMTDGTLLIADWSDAHSGIYTMNPVTDELKNMFEGTWDKTGAYTNNGVVIGGGSTGVSAVGSGKDTKLYAFLEDYPAGNAGNKLVRYDIGESRTISAAPNAVFETVSKLMANTNVEVRAFENGFWAGQTRGAGNNTGDVPCLVYADNEGNVLYNSGKSNTDLNGCWGSAFALNIDNSRLAIVNANSDVNVYEVAWNENVPTLTFLYTLDSASAQVAVRELAFDRAGNLYVSNGTEMQLWSLPSDENVGVTPAAESIEVNHAGVGENIASEDVKVYPNPASEILNVETAEPINSLTVFNMAGAAVYAEYSVNGSSAQINVAELATGVYFVNVNGNTTVRFIKK